MKKFFVMAAMAPLLVACGKKNAETQNAETKDVDVEMAELPTDVKEAIDHNITASMDGAEVSYNSLMDTNNDGKNEIIVRVKSPITDECSYDVYSFDTDYNCYMNRGGGGNSTSSIKDDYLVYEQGALLLGEGVKSATIYVHLSAMDYVTKNVMENGSIEYKVYPEGTMEQDAMEALAKKLDAVEGVACESIKEWKKIK